MQRLRIPEVHRVEVEANLGFRTITIALGQPLVYEHGGEASFAQTIIDQLVACAVHREGVALDPRIKHWVFIAGLGVENVVGRLYRGFMPQDFQLRNWTARCSGALLPEDCVAHPCAMYPTCTEWATFQFGVLAPIYDFFLGQSWEEGDTIWTCPKHAREVYDAAYYWDRIAHTRHEA